MAQQESGEPNERKNTVLVVSPLTQLMQAQVQSLTSARINAIFISSTRVVSLLSVHAQFILQKTRISSAPYLLFGPSFRLPKALSSR